jgi:hypothetical protein
MGELGPVLFLLTLIMVAWLTLACGGSPERELESVTLSPATAAAQDFPGGQVQFSATGQYNTSPQTVTPLPGRSWGSCFQDASTTDVTVNSDGVAQCAIGAVGTYTVWAHAPRVSTHSCLSEDACGAGCEVVGSAQLTCP